MADFVEKHQRLTDPYVTAGNRFYVIGTQDGDFPDLGGHIPGEMMGIWDHPIKLADGFFVGICRDDSIEWQKADTFRTYPFYTEHLTSQEGYELVRRQFVPDDEEGVIITLSYTNRSDAEQSLTLVFAVRSDIRPGWLGTEVDGYDLADQQDGHLIFRDPLNPWAAMVATDSKNYAIQIGADLPHETAGLGASAAINIPISCKPGETVVTRFVIAGSTCSLAKCQETLERILESAEQAFARKKQRYAQLDAMSALTVPHPSIQAALQWIKYNTDWLDRQTDFGRGLGAGLPEYPWWFGCDNGYAVPGILSLGWFEMAKDTMRLLAKISEEHNGNGRIIHEMSTTGIVYNPGNAQETPQFCMAVWDVFAWTGDIEFLRDLYPVVQKAIDWTLKQTSDHTDFPIGYGIIEVEHFNDYVIDSAVYTYQALLCGAQMADVFADGLVATLLRDRAKLLKTDILDKFWLEQEGLFADVLARPSVMNEKLRAWAKRATELGLTEASLYYEGLVDESGSSEQRAYLLKHWVINTPLEVGLAPKAQAVRALDRMRQEFFGPHGMYLSGLEKQAMMTISTGIQAIAEAVNGRPDEAVMWIEKVTDTLNQRMPGAITEMSPDYGCFVQAWTVHSVYSPIIRFLFGVTPVAYEGACILDPHMPSTWDRAELKGLRVGQTALDLRYERVDGQDVLSVCSSQAVTLRFSRLAVCDEVGTGMAALEWKLEAGSEVTVRLAKR